MKIIIINWERHLIEEYETDSVKYEKDEISFTMWIEPGRIKTIEKIKYNQLLGIKES